MRVYPSPKKLTYVEILKHIVQGFALLALVGGGALLAAGVPAVNLAEVALVILLFMYVDITGIDGGAVYALARLLGSSADYDDHVSYIAAWKPYVFALQATGIAFHSIGAQWGLLVYYLFTLVELGYFWITMKLVHRLSNWRTALVLAAIITVMVPAFLSPESITTMSEVARGNLNAVMP